MTRLPLVALACAATIACAAAPKRTSEPSGLMVIAECRVIPVEDSDARDEALLALRQKLDRIIVRHRKAFQTRPITPADPPSDAARQAP